MSNCSFASHRHLCFKAQRVKIVIQIKVIKMKELKLFGCHEFNLGGKIVGCITFVENAVRAIISLIFLVWSMQELKTQKLEKGSR